MNNNLEYIRNNAPDGFDMDSLQLAVGGKSSGGIRAGGTSAGKFTTMIGDAIRGSKGAWRIDSEGQVVPRL